MIVFKIHVKVLSMYLKYYFKYMYFKILPITESKFSSVKPTAKIKDEDPREDGPMTWWTGAKRYLHLAQIG